MDWASLTVPEAVAIAGLGGTLLAVYKGVVDARTAKAANTQPAAAITSPKNEVAIDIDKRYVEAMESLSTAFTSVATANTRLGEVNLRQAIAMEGISKALADWIHKYERDKDEDRLDALETQVTRIYNIIAPPEAKPARRRQLHGETE